MHVAAAHRPLGPRRHLLALLLSALLVVVLGAAAAATPPPNGPPGKPDRGRDSYVAMGDSFAAGVGTGLPDLNVPCYRSSEAYAPIIDVERFDTSLDFVACSGATTTSLIATQLGPLDRQTDFVTVSIGGNDIGFGSLVAACVGGPSDAVCQAAVAQADQKIQQVLPGQLDAAYGAIRDRVRKAEVIVVDYPRFFAQDYAPCGQSTGVTAAEAPILNDMVDQLDAVIRDRAAAADFTFVDVRDQFTGHDMCAAQPWLNGVLVPAADRYHPNANGYRLGFTPLVEEAMAKRQPSRP